MGFSITTAIGGESLWRCSDGAPKHPQHRTSALQAFSSMVHLWISDALLRFQVCLRVLDLPAYQADEILPERFMLRRRKLTFFTPLRTRWGASAMSVTSREPHHGPPSAARHPSCIPTLQGSMHRAESMPRRFTVMDGWMEVAFERQQRKLMTRRQIARTHVIMARSKRRISNASNGR